MADAEGKTPQGTMLSAEVEPFIPGQTNSTKVCGGRPQPQASHAQPTHPGPVSGHGYTASNAGTTHPGAANAKVPVSPAHPTISSPNGSSYTLTELPRYLTNCYPFVQDSVTGTGPKPDVRWPNYPSQQPPSTALNSAPQYPSASSDMYASQQYPLQSPSMVMQYPQSYFAHPQGPPPSLQNQSTMQAPVPMQQASFHIQPHYPGYYSNYPPEGNQLSMGPYQNAAYGPYVPREAVHRQSRYSNNRDRQIAGLESSKDRSLSASCLDGRRYPKTLVCMDSGCQTDFPDDIANKTLAEKPSMLRRHKSKPRRRSQGNQTGQETSTSTDSETEAGAVDSDSGYYSPKHAKNSNISVGMATHDAATGPTMKVQGYQQVAGSVVSTGPRHAPQNPPVGGQTPAYSNPNTVHQVAVSPQQMVPAAANYPPPQQLHHPVAPRVQPQQQQQQQVQQPSLNQHGPPPMSYARILSQPPPQHQPLPVSNQPQHRPPALFPQQGHFNKPIDKLRRSPNVASSVAFAGSQTAQQRPAGKYVAAEEAADRGPAQNSKRKKKKERKRGGKGQEGADEHMTEIEVQPAPPPPTLADMGDFPELPVGASGCSESINVQSAKPCSYSAILQQRRSAPIVQQEDPDPNESSDANQSDIIKPEDLLNPEAAASGIRDGKNARKRRKKAILAAQAAAKEYSEITEEQRQLQENLKKPSKKTKMPIEYDLGDMLAALEKQQLETKAKTQQQVLAGKGRSAAPPTTSKLQHHKENQQSSVPTVASTSALKAGGYHGIREQELVMGHNPLDSSAPLKRGKEREAPVKKKPSALKRVILKEREENKRLRTLQETCLSDAEDGLNQGDEKTMESMSGDAGLGLSQDASERGPSISPFMTSQSDLSPLSQMSPMSMSPLSPGSPLSSGLSSPATGFKSASPAQSNPSIHSRRFREYCNQVLDKDIDACCTTLLQTLVRFQDRQYHKDPSKAKAKRRIVMGLREVTKHLKLKKIKCIMVSPNLERIQSKGGLDDALNRIMALSAEQNVPVVFALGRKALGRAVNKLVPVSVVGIFNYDGAEEFYKNLLDLTKSARENYNSMIRKYQQELEAAASAVPFTKHRHHLGHYRNLSGCSGISFSSVISEPISEDYPDPEPEVDSRGNEIVREVRFDDEVKTTQYTAATPVSMLTTQEFIDTDLAGDHESDRGFSQEGTHSEDSGTVEQGASKTSSETLEVAEFDDIDYEDGENEDTCELSDVDEELDGIDDDFHHGDLEEDEEEEVEEDEDGGISVLNSETDLPVDKGRIANWVAEAQTTIQTLTLDDTLEGSCTSADVSPVPQLAKHRMSEDEKQLTGCQDNQACEEPSTDKMNSSVIPEGNACTKTKEDLAKSPPTENKSS